MKLVIIESPFAPANGRSEADHLQYLGDCVRDSLARGEAPLAAHGFYTQFLDDANTYQRRLGIECGLAWAERADLQVFYEDLGWSAGMYEAWYNSKAKAKEIRRIGQEADPMPRVITDKKEPF